MFLDQKLENLRKRAIETKSTEEERLKLLLKRRDDLIISPFEELEEKMKQNLINFFGLQTKGE